MADIHQQQKDANDKSNNMIKKVAKITRKSVETVKKTTKSVSLKAKEINVKNVDGDTTATILVRNDIKYVPKVSVIIPVYNVDQYLRQCLDSVINQTLREIEIICVDDGSTDNSMEILKEYAARDNRITIMEQKHLYAGVARNAGLTVAKGQYVHFMDSDDWVEPDVLKQLVDIMEAENPDFIKFKNYMYDNDKKQNVPDDWISISYLPENMFNRVLGEESKVLLTDLPDSPWSGLYNLKFINDNLIRFDSLKCCNDVSFFLRVLVAAKKIYVSDKTYVHYRINRPESLIAIRVNNFKFQIQLFYNAQRILKNSDDKLKSKFLSHLVNVVMYRFSSYIKSNIDISVKEEIFQQVSTFLKDVPNNLINRCQSMDVIRDIKKYNSFSKFYNNAVLNKHKHKLFYKKRLDDGECIIYILGIRVLSYRKEKIKHALEYPIRIYDKYHRLKDKIREIKKGK